MIRQRIMVRSLDVEIRRLPAAASIITPPGTWQFLWSKAEMTELSTLSTATMAICLAGSETFV